MNNQMKEIDWSKAPHGATHFRHDDPKSPWRMLKDGVWHAWFCGEWMTVTTPAEHFYIARPAWSGEGLPPVGAVCECQDESFKWKPGTIVYVGQGDGAIVAVMQADSGILIGEKGEFRPLCTPEQIAAEERRAAILEMKGHLSFSDYREAEQHCAALYDAGYRKVTA